jgi:S1-C subfamily serine protease
VPELILQIAQFLYDQPQGQWISLAQLYQALPGQEREMIDDALQKLLEQDLIKATFQRTDIRLGPAGREAWNDESIVELTLGMPYVGQLYGAATVQIVVTGIHGENAGSGFFCHDYPGWIVSAAHVLRGREILRINDVDGRVIAGPPLQIIAPENDLDLALIRCACPAGVKAIRVEWRRHAISAMEPLLVLGYPSLPNLMPGLDHISAQLRQVARDFRGEREFLVMSSTTLPGSSGGPVLSRRGRVVGVVEQENMREQLGQNSVHAFTATPTLYLAELSEAQ